MRDELPARRPRIIAFAYACTPGVGSEGGAGWAWAEMLARVGEVWVLTRPFAVRREDIQERLNQLPADERPHVVFLDLPRWAGGGRETGSVRLMRVRYLFWQALALREARRLHRRHRFDLAWHLTFSNVWLGSLASAVGPPFIYGPVGGGVSPPWRLVPRLGWRGAAYEVLRAVAKSLARHANPVVRMSWRNAALILAQNVETRNWFPASEQHKVEIFANTILEGADLPTRGVESGDRADPPGQPPLALFAGRLLPLKGVALALEVMRLLPGWCFVICGAGPDEGRLRMLARRFGVEDRVEFRGWVPRRELLALMQRADVMLFPSFHEEAGWAVAEAVSVGLPVVCLDRGGPVLMASEVVRSGWPGETIQRLAAAVETARFGPRPPRPLLDEASRREQLVELLDRRGLLGNAADDHPETPPGIRVGD
ncbi:MAG: glycosyltransferase [Chloroflexi bacterium]|nr:MAG: glycosyltransferase [Chloroflexota bacterium]